MNVVGEDQEKDLVYTLPEAAARLKCSGRFLRQEINDGKLRAFHLGRGRAWRIRREELDAYIRRQERGDWRRPFPARSEKGTFVRGGDCPLLEKRGE